VPPRRLLLLVVLVALAAHARSLGAGFVYDDRLAVIENPVLAGGFDPAGWLGRDYWGLPPGEGAGTWRPLPLASLWLDRQLGGGAPWMFHLTNIIVHALASLALALASRSALAGVVFAALAVNTEAVAGIVGRADVMAAGLCFAAWGLARRSAPAAAAAFFAALLCKESAIVFPVWLVAVERPRRAQLWLLLSVAAYVALRAASFGLLVEDVFRSANNNLLLDEPLGVRALTALRLFWLALRLIIFPVELAPDYAFAALLPARGLEADVVAGGVALVLLVLLAPRVRALAIFVAGFAVIANVVTPLPAIFAERLLYLPAAGIAVAVAAGLTALATRARLVSIAIGALLIGGNLARAVVRDGDWRDDLTLFAAAVETTPRSARSWTNLGAALARAERHEDAAAALARAIEIAPRWAAPRTLAGASLDALGERELAEAQLRRALALDPRSEDARYNLGLFLARRGRHAEAAEVLEGARSPKARALREDLRPR
jgi:tetratricopeptide (TPR) repeat protein